MATLFEPVILKNGEWVKEGGNWYYYDSNSDIVRKLWKLM